MSISVSSIIIIPTKMAIYGHTHYPQLLVRCRSIHMKCHQIQFLSFQKVTKPRSKLKFEKVLLSRE